MSNPDKLRWKFEAKYNNMTYTNYFEEISDAEAWVEDLPTWTFLESITITYERK